MTSPENGVDRGVQGPGDKTGEGEKPIFRQETHQGEEGLGRQLGRRHRVRRIEGE